MIILQKVKINNKLIELYFKVHHTKNELIISIAPNQVYDTEVLIEIPCVNTYNAIYFMKIEFPIKFNIFIFKKKSYIFNERLFEIGFNSQDIILDFFHPILKKTNLNLIKPDDFDNNKIILLLFENLENFSNTLNTESLNYQYFLFNKSLLILYVFEVYTNKEIKNSKYNKYIKKKELMYCNSLKQIELVFKKSNLFSIENHIKIINDKMEYITPCYYFISNKNKFRKSYVNNINNNTVELKEGGQSILYDKKIITISYYPPNLKELTSKKNFFTFLINESSNIIKKIENKSLSNVDMIEHPENIEDVHTFVKQLFDKYTFPIKYNRRFLDEVFEKIIYISIYYSDKLLILIDRKLYLHPEIISSVPNKVKTLYFNILKIFYQSKNNNFESIYFNTKLYLDSIHYEVLKIICERDTLLNRLNQSFNLDKIIKNFKLLNKLKCASTIITWKNIPKKISIFKLLLDNKKLIFFKDKVNKNILSDNCDNRLKKILKDPLEMFRFLKSDKDYIRWIELIDSSITNIYYNQFNVPQKKYSILGTILYLINTLEEQTFSNKKYSNLIKISKKNKNLILSEYRINLKIKEYLNNNNINLGYLAKHINSSYNDPTSFSNENELNLETELESEMDDLKKKIKDANKKYYKYKSKYHKLKTLTNTETVFNSTMDI